MQHWFTILNLSGWKVHFITLGLEFFNFFSLASGKIESFGILAVGLDINLKKPSFIEGGTMGFLALTLVWTCLKHSHSSPACFSLVQSLAKVNSIFLFLSFFMSHQCTFFYSHVPWLVCITSVTPLALTLPIVASIGYKILSSLRCCSGGWDVCYKSKWLWSNLGFPFKVSGAQHHCLEFGVCHLRVNKRVVVE